MLRFLPLIGVVLLAGIAFCWRPWLQFRRHGTWGIILFSAGGRGQWLRDGFAVVLFILLLGQTIVAAASPDWLTSRRIDHESVSVIVQVIGAALMFGGLALLVAAQLDLGASWRIGIEDEAKPGLVTRGLYRFCRNPIFLALLIIVAGYALLLPTWLSLALLLGTYIGTRLQISAEETYLLRIYGSAYRDYASRVGRFVPGIGLFR